MKGMIIKVNKVIREQKGVTLIVLVVTIIVLLILASITMYGGTDIIDKSRLEGLKTNMLLIQTKAKEYVENAKFQLGIKPEEATETMKEKARLELEGEDKGTKVNVGDSFASEATRIGISQAEIEEGNVYWLSTSNLEKMGIKGTKSDEKRGYYIIVYNMEEISAEIYNTVGYKDIYSLTDIENIKK